MTAIEAHDAHESTAARDVAYALLALLVCFALTTIVQSINLPTPSSTLVFILAYLVVFLLIAAPVVIVCIVQHSSTRAVGLTGPRPLFSNAAGIAVLVAVALVGPPLLDALFTGQHVIASVMTVRTIATFAIAAVAEEYIFRGFVQPRLVAWSGPVCGILLTSICFSLFHLPKFFIAGLELPNLIVLCVLIAIAGALFGTAAYLFKDIYAATWLHLAANVLVGML